jgi:hypothetical protein
VLNEINGKLNTVNSKLRSNFAVRADGRRGSGGKRLPFQVKPTPKISKKNVITFHKTYITAHQQSLPIWNLSQQQKLLGVSLLDAGNTEQFG